MFDSSIFAIMKKLMIIVSVSVVFWNVENFFDYIDRGGGESDKEFSSLGVRHWTKKRFLSKCSAIARTLFWIEDLKGNIPDVVAFEEIENRWVLSRLLSETVLKKLDYEVIHFESEDHRGIDVALMYRKSRLKPVMTFPVCFPGMKTRDILFAGFITMDGDSLVVSVNHHPSKYGGETSDASRLVVARRMVEVHDSLYALGWRYQLAGGDFNDIPTSRPSQEISRSMVCKALPLFSKGEGTIRFDGNWELIDLAFVTEDMDNMSRMEILRPPFLTVKDTSHSGTKPLRTYSGPKYQGGVSDHYPIMIWIEL